jgi:hypothetical protein
VVFVNRGINEEIDKEEIKKNINELRDTLNEICVTQEDTKEVEKRLILSQKLDELIVQYMNNDKL